MGKRLLVAGATVVAVAPWRRSTPDCTCPVERSPEQLRELERRVEDAEASHAILLVAMVGVAVHAAARGWWTAAILTVLLDILMNGNPVMFQRYNRVLLHARFPVQAGFQDGGYAFRDPLHGGATSAATAGFNNRYVPNGQAYPTGWNTSINNGLNDAGTFTWSKCPSTWQPTTA